MIEFDHVIDLFNFLNALSIADGLFQYEACSQCFDLYRGETKGDKFCSCCALLGNRVERATNKIMYTYHSLGEK